MVACGEGLTTLSTAELMVPPIILVRIGIDLMVASKVLELWVKS